MDAEDHRAPAGAAKFVLLAALLFILAVVLARFILQGSWGWAVAAASVPIVLVILRLLVGWAAAFLLLGFFATAILFLRTILSNPKVSWSLLLLLGVFSLSALLAGRVAVGLFLMKRESRLAERDQEKNAKMEREGEGK